MSGLREHFREAVADVPVYGDLDEAIGQVRRRRARLGGLAASLVVGGGAAALGISVGDSDPAGFVSPTEPSGTSSADPGPADGSPASQLQAILDGAPSWQVDPDIGDDYDYAFNGPCSGDWGADADGGADGGVSARPGEVSHAGHGHYGFTSAIRASAAANRFIESLESCAATRWRTQAIPGTGVVLAWSPQAVAWIQRRGDRVDVVQLPTPDGPPPRHVQGEVARWLGAYVAQLEQNGSSQP